MKSEIIEPQYLKMTEKSFIVNPEIKLLISSKSTSRKPATKDASHKLTSSQVKFSERELDLLKKVSELKLEKLSTNESTKEKHVKHGKTTALTLLELKQLKHDLGDNLFLCDIIDGAELKLPENEIKERDPELEKRIQRLKAQQEQRAYNSMTKNVDSSRKFIPEETISYQCKFQCFVFFRKSGDSTNICLNLTSLVLVNSETN